MDFAPAEIHQSIVSSVTSSRLPLRFGWLFALPLLCVWACGRMNYEPLAHEQPTQGDAAAFDVGISYDAIISRDGSEEAPVAPQDAPPAPDAAPVDARGELYAARGCNALDGLVVCDVHEKKRDFASAQALCGELGLTLATVKTVNQHDRLVAWARSRQLVEVMVGGSDAGEEGLWTWPDGSQLWSGGASGQAPAGGFVKWFPGEPNNANGVENCLTIYAPSDAWNDVPCAFLFPGLACE